MDTRSIAWLLSCSLIFSPLAHATTYFVTTTGSDSTSCAAAQSRTSPRRSINQGIRCLSGGDTLIVGSGTYNEILTDYDGAEGYAVRPPSGASWQQPTIIKAEARHSVTLQVPTPPREWSSLLAFGRAGTAYIELDGFVLNGKVGRPACPFHCPGIIKGIALEGGGGFVRYKNLLIDHPIDQGVQGTGSPGTEFIDVDIRGVAINPTTGANECAACAPSDHGGRVCPEALCHPYYVHGSGLLVDGGTLDHARGYGHQWYANNSIIRNQTVCNMLGHGTAFIGTGNTVSNMRYQSSAGAVLAFAGVRGNRIVDNLMMGAAVGAKGPAFWDQGGGNAWENNREVAGGGSCPVSAPPVAHPLPAPKNLRAVVR